MLVSEAMTHDVQLIHPDQSLLVAAKMMADCDCGSLPVAQGDRLVGMITDRDIVVRGMAHGKDGDSTVKEVMSPDVKYCFEDEDLEEVARNMGDIQMRRLPVLNHDKRLVGIVSLGDIAISEESPAAEALASISEPSSQHQSSGLRPH